MRTRIAALLLAVPALARGQTVDATAQTLLTGRQDPRDGTVHTVAPAYEDVYLSARDLQIPGIEATRVLVNATGDLDIAFIEGKLFQRHLDLRAGRQLVASGVARNLQLDGLDAVVRVPYGIGLELYGGIPVTPRFGYAKGQGAVGGRLFWKPLPKLEAGVSFVDVIDLGRVARQEAGVDARVVLSDRLTLTGLAALATTESRLAEAALRALWQPARDVELTLEAARTAPDLFVSRASIFSVFAEETRDEAGATLYLRPAPRLRLWADGYAIDDEAGVGARGGLRGSLALDAAAATTVGVEGRVLAVPDDRYVQARAYAARRFSPRVTATLDLASYWLAPNVNGQDLSLTGAATLAWDFAPGWRTVVTGIAGRTPLLESRFEGMAKLVYNFAVRAHQQVAP